MPKEQSAAICFQTFRDKNKESSQDWRKLEFTVPITELSGDGKSENFRIKGVAINETTTRNGVRYVSEELSKSAHTLRNKPILKDHTNSVDSIVGRTTENVSFDPINNRINFEGQILDKSIQEKINMGLISSVSVGATVQDLEESNNEETGENFVIARGIDFVEISLVAVPADPNAGFAKAVMESFELKKASEQVSNSNVKLEETKMAEEAKETVSEPTAVAMPQELLDSLSKINEGITALGNRVQKVEELQTVKEEAEEPAAEEEKVEDKTEGKVSPAETDTAEEGFEDYIFERAEGKGFALSKKSYDATKYKVLGRQ